MSKAQAQSWRRVWALLQALPRPGFWVTGKASSMRISLGDVYSIGELSRSFERIIHILTANGVDEVRGANLYFTLVHDRRAIALLDEHGREIDHLKLNPPSPRAFKSVSPNIHTIAARKPKATEPNSGNAA
jgi:hypothetical protein